MELRRAHLVRGRGTGRGRVKGRDRGRVVVVVVVVVRVRVRVRVRVGLTLAYEEDGVGHLALPHHVLAAVELERGDDAGEPP